MKRLVAHAALAGCGPVFFALWAVAASAAPVKIFETRTREDFLAGRLEGVSVDQLGRVALADSWARVGAIEEPFLLSAASHPDGWVVGTGNDGRVLKVDRSGKVETLFTASEPAVFALAVAADGTVYAGTSPQGKVYRLKDGASEVFFDPGQTYVWALALDADGRLLVATGAASRLFRVRAAGKAETLLEHGQEHLRSLVVAPSGEIYLGTAEGGLVLRLGEDGEVATLYDATQPEIAALALGPDGSLWAAAVGSEASLLAHETPKAPGETAPPPEGGAAGAGSVAVVEESEATAGSGSRSGGKGPRSQILRLDPGGAVEAATSLESETVYALAWQGGKLWIATGMDGGLYSFDGRLLSLAARVEDRQLVALLSAPEGLALASTNAAALYRPATGGERRGTYTSTVADAGQIARFGSLHWAGELPPGAKLAFAVRTGHASEPDDTWSAWTEAAAGNEVALAAVPPGRFLQWRAELAGTPKVSPMLAAVEVSYRQQNLRPQIKSLTVLDPGQIVVPAGFNPGSQTFEPAHPNRDGIFTSLVPADGAEEGRQKTLWKHGFRTLKWEASDPNGDVLRYRVEVRPEAKAESWLPVAEDLQGSSFSFDVQSLPDGAYRFRLVATEQAVEGTERLANEQVTAPVVIDHSPPALASVERKGGKVRLTIRDASSPLKEVVVSDGGGPWRAVEVVDGLLDGRAEVVELPAAPAGTFRVLRATDAAWNVVTFDLSGELSGAPR
ncbi:MAG TPA: hypothetical protein VF017_21110 [Thermoanaerobaculia bacterium]|nr:hypothetical protein [Thermoanaerobaculia bacterium]